MEQSPAWEPNSRSASQEIPSSIYATPTRMYIIVFKRAQRWSLS
jgi:hypothetical protein